MSASSGSWIFRVTPYSVWYLVDSLRHPVNAGPGCWVNRGGIMADDLANVYELVAERLVGGKVIPVLGASANLGDRPPDVGYQRGRYLPNGEELAEELARLVHYPRADVLDLARVSQYVAAQLGESSLYDELHDVFDADYPPTLLHYFLARLARHMREAAAARECMLIVTTKRKSWAIEAHPNPVDRATWDVLGVDILPVRVESFVAMMEQRLPALVVPP